MSRPSLLCGKAATLLQEGGSGHCQRNSLVSHAWIMSWGAPDPGAGARVALLFALVPSASCSGPPMSSLTGSPCTQMFS